MNIEQLYNLLQKLMRGSWLLMQAQQKKM